MGQLMPDGKMRHVQLNEVARGRRKYVPSIVIETHIAAPRERCFDLARNVDIHCQTLTD